MTELTQGAVAALCREEKDLKATLQLLSVKPSKGDKLLVHISDGEQHMPAYISSALAKQLEFPVNCIIKLTQYNMVLQKEKTKPWPVVMCMAVEVLSTDAEKIGDPKAPGGEANNNTPVKKQIKQEVSSPEPKKAGPVISPSPVGPAAATTPPKASQGPPKSTSASPLAMSQGTDRHVLIGDLNPYMPARWTIKGRVISKKDVRTFAGKQGGDKHVFDLTVMDESCDMKIVFWDELVDKYHASLEVGKCYTFSAGSLRVANKKYNDTKSEYEMTAKSDIKIEMVEDSDAPAVRYRFTSIDKLEEQIGKSVDVIGLVQDVQPLGEITIKKGADAGKQKNKRNISIADKSGKLIALTLWDDHAMAVTEEHQASNAVVCVRAVKVSDYSGCSINTTRNSLVQVDADIPEAKELREWFAGRADATPFQAVGGGAGGKGERGPALRRLMSDINEKGLGLGDKPDYFSLRATITYFRTKDKDGNSSVWQYPSNPENKKKVVQVGDEWHDESTGKVLKECQRRYILGVSCCDMSGSNFVTAFDDQAKQILGTSADELYQLGEADPRAAENTWSKALFQTLILKVRAKNERYNDQDRVKCSIIEVAPVNFKAESSNLLEQIRRYNL